MVQEGTKSTLGLWLIYWRSYTETTLCKKMVPIIGQIFIEHLLCPRPVSGPENAGEQIHKVPAFVHRQKVSKQRNEVLLCCASPRKEITE